MYIHTFIYNIYIHCYKQCVDIGSDAHNNKSIHTYIALYDVQNTYIYIYITIRALFRGRCHFASPQPSRRIRFPSIAAWPSEHTLHDERSTLEK